MPTTNIVEVTDFSMAFDGRTVIDTLSFDVRAGEIFGFLGSNGSGKTTTIRALLDLYQPTAGTLTINGRRFSARRDASIVGYLPEERGLYKKERVGDVMRYFARLKGMGNPKAHSWVDTYLERVGLHEKINEKIEKLSGGQQQKVQLGLTIMNQPQLLILDEPTKGLDPVNRRLLMDIIDEQHQGGAAIILVTHQMEEVERLCARALLLKNGNAEAYGTLDTIKDDFGGKRIIVRYGGTLPKRPQLYEATKIQTAYAELAPMDGVDPQRILRELASTPGFTMTTFDVQRPTLDEIFVSVYGKEAESHV